MSSPYFYVQARVGITKHPGGWNSTKKLIRLCEIDKSKHVLVAGCGTGTSALKIAKVSGCKITGIDLSPEMVKVALKDAKNTDFEFKVGGVQKLPFKDNTFDAVLSESVTAFPPDKQKAIKEYARVLKPGGFVGMSETTWLSPPPKELVDYVFNVMGEVRPESKENWKKLLENAGLKIVLAEETKIKVFEQAMGEMQLTGFTQSLKAGYNFFKYYLTEKKFRQGVHSLVKSAMRLPKGFLKYLGSGIYVGKKPI